MTSDPIFTPGGLQTPPDTSKRWQSHHYTWRSVNRCFGTRMDAWNGLGVVSDSSDVVHIHLWEGSLWRGGRHVFEFLRGLRTPKTRKHLGCGLNATRAVECRGQIVKWRSVGPPGGPVQVGPAKWASKKIFQICIYIYTYIYMYITVVLSVMSCC